MIEMNVEDLPGIEPLQCTVNASLPTIEHTHRPKEPHNE